MNTPLKPMKQITIITKDYHGLTADLTSALAGNDINIETLDAKKIDDVGVITLVVDQYTRALHVLNDAGWSPIEEDTMLVRVIDEPGAIASLAERLRDADLHICSMRVVQHHGDWGAIAVSADPIEEARSLVKEDLLSITPVA